MAYYSQTQQELSDFNTSKPSWTETLINNDGLHQSHFWEWFDADELSVVWSQTSAGVGVFAMADGADEGFSITTGTSSGNNSRIAMGNIKHYNGETMVIIYSMRRVASAADGGIACGYTTEPSGILGSSVNDQLTLNDNETVTNKAFFFNDGSIPATSIDTGVPTSTDWSVQRMDNNGTFARAFISGILRATATTDLPDAVGVQPAFFVQRGVVSAVAQEGRIRYLEVFTV